MSFSSLRAAAKAMTKRERVIRLDISKSGDLQCKTIMCEKVGGACPCRLARFVGQAASHLTHLEALDVSDSALDVLPTAVFESLPSLKELSARNNKLVEFPSEVNLLKNLETLDLRGNSLKSLPLMELAYLQPKLKRVDVRNNPVELRQNVEQALVSTKTKELESILVFI